MNPLCSEAAIRKASDWRAFKHGSELVAAVSDAANTDDGWRGVVRDGRRPHRVSVIARSASDMEVRCPCRENQSSGAFCAHAVAVGLFLASGKSSAPGRADDRQTAPATPRPPQPSMAWEIHFPPPWRRMLADGKLAIRIVPCTESPDAADARITGWLSDMGSPGGGMLQPDGQRLGAFLLAAADHPRVRCETQPIEITGDAFIRIASVSRHGDRVEVTPESREIQRIGHFTAEIAEDRVSLITKPLPAPLKALSNGKSADLPLQDFLEIAESLNDFLTWPDHGWLADLVFVAAKPEISMTIRASGRCLEVMPLVQYDGSPAVVPGEGNVANLPEISGKICRIRDRKTEADAVRELELHGFARSENSPGLWRLSDESRIVDFVSEGLSTLGAQCTIHHGPGLEKRIREMSVISPKFEILGSGEDWLEFNLSFETSDRNESIDPTEVWRLLKTGGGGKGRRLTRELTELIDPLFSELEFAQENGRFVARGASVFCVQEIHKYLTKTNDINDLSKSDFRLPASLIADLRPYQLAGASWMWDRLRAMHGVLLADDMGLGKTIQTIAVIERLFDDLLHGNLDVDGNGEACSGSVLVVATTSLLGNWRAEFAKFAPERRVRVLHGAAREVEKDQVGSGEVWLTSFNTLSRDLAWYLRRGFLAVVVDEASLMRNPDTDHAKALFKLRARHRIALSGTPVENGARDLWSIFRFIQPGWLGGRREFQERYEAPVAVGEVPALRRLRIKTAPFMLRRTKEEVAPELPSKILIDEFVDLSADQQAVYRELLAEGRRGVERLMDAKNQGAARMQMLTVLLRLRQACCDLSLLGSDRFKQMIPKRRSSKMERLLELVDSAVSGNHKILVFSQFRSQLHEILQCLESRNIKAIQLDGTSRNRQALVDCFQSEGGPPVFLISLKAGGYGLNLTAADVVIHFDPWWNPAAEAQATDRAHRIGQTRPVTVYRLLARGTVEEKVVALQRRKRSIAAAIDEAGGGEAAGWSEGDLAGLFD